MSARMLEVGCTCASCTPIRVHVLMRLAPFLTHADTWIDMRGLDVGPFRIVENWKGNNDRVLELSVKV